MAFKEIAVCCDFFYCNFIAGDQNALDEKIAEVIASIGSNNSAESNKSTGLYHEIEIIKETIEQPNNQTKSKLPN